MSDEIEQKSDERKAHCFYQDGSRFAKLSAVRGGSFHRVKDQIDEASTNDSEHHTYRPGCGVGRNQEAGEAANDGQ